MATKTYVMINILALRCSRALAPYLRESIAEFLKERRVDPRVVRQGGYGLAVRNDTDLVLRYQGRESRLDSEDASHYRATLEARTAWHQISRMTDEVVLSNVGAGILLSHPQSELWLERRVAETLARMYAQSATPAAELPVWLNASVGGGRLLLSDQRTGRWVLLGNDHVEELENRIRSLPHESSASGAKPPTIDLKGLAIHLQSACRLRQILVDFGGGGPAPHYEEMSPEYSLRVARATEGIELSDSNRRAAMTRREARKWAEVIDIELDRLNIIQTERGRIRTVFADGDAGRWVLQWGDEILWRSDGAGSRRKEVAGLITILDEASSSCVALTESEAALLGDVR